jgi:tetratricopeptide (TPR) repeat protein
VVGVVPARILSHKPPPAARREFERGTKAWGKSKNDEAIGHLSEAIRLDPGYIEAQVSLGAVYADSGRLEQALAMFDRALALEPNWALIHVDLAAALITLNRPEEAEMAARRALRLAPGSITASYMLGWSMLMQNKITPETADNLAIAAGKYPLARKALKPVRERLAEDGR